MKIEVPMSFIRQIQYYMDRADLYTHEGRHKDYDKDNCFSFTGPYGVYYVVGKEDKEFTKVTREYKEEIKVVTREIREYTDEN